MRICYVCADSGVSLAKHNGSAAHLRAIVGAFRELGHEVEVLLANPDGAESLGVPVRAIPRPSFARKLGAVARNLQGVEELDDRTDASLRALRRVWINPGLERALGSALRRFRPDVVYERHSPFIVAGPLVAARGGCPHVLEVNAPLAWEGRQHRGQGMADEAELLERLAFASSSRIVAVSAELRDQLVDVGVDAAKIRVVPNGVDTRRFDPAPSVTDEPLAGKTVIGFVGSLKGWHGVDALTAAFERLAVDRPEVHLLIVGDGPLAQHVESFRARFPDRVTWTGAVRPEDIPAQLATMRIAVAPYPTLERFYFSPLKVLEYMAAGSAIVGSRVGQLERLLCDGENGLLVEPGNVTALAAALGRLVEDPELCRRLGARAREDAVREHRWSQRAEQILELVRREAA